MMAKIAEHMEQSEDFPYNQLLDVDLDASLPNSARITFAISRSTVSMAEAVHASAILSSTESGRTARIVARHRPKMPVLGVTPFASTARRMQMMWGVVPAEVEAFHHTDEMIQRLVRAANSQSYAHVGDNVVLTAGIPLEIHGVTNMVKVHTVREEDLP